MTLQYTNIFTTSTPESGRLLTQGDSKSVVVGHGLAHGTFKTDLGVNSLILINNKPFRVIGILTASTGLAAEAIGLLLCLQKMPVKFSEPQ